MSERTKFEVVSLLARLATFSAPLLITFAVWQESEIRRLSEGVSNLKEWKAEYPISAQIGHERLKLEIIAIVSGQLTAIQQSIVRMETQLEYVAKKRDVAFRENERE